MPSKSTKQITWNPKDVKGNCFSYKDNVGKYRIAFTNSHDINNKGKYYIKEISIN